MPVYPIQWVRASGPQVLLQAHSHLLCGRNGYGLLLIFKQPWWIFHELSMQFATSCFNYDQSSKRESCWTAERALFISQPARMAQLSLRQWLKCSYEKTMGFHCEAHCWWWMSEKCVPWQKSHIYLHVMNIILPCFLMFHHGKGLQPLSE